MPKTELTKKIERALFSWYPKTFAGYRVDTFRAGFGATEVPAENGTTTGGLIDYARVQECFIRDELVGACKLDRYFDSEPLEIQDTIKKMASGAGCKKDLQEFSFRKSVCDREDCKYHKQKKRFVLDTVIVCVEIKVSVSDFNSKHGHNFAGNVNYYAVPADMYPKIQDRIPEGIGVLLYHSGPNLFGIRKKVEATYCELSAEQQKWLILSIAKRHNKYLKARLKEAEKAASQNGENLF